MESGRAPLPVAVTDARRARSANAPPARLATSVPARVRTGSVVSVMRAEQIFLKLRVSGSGFPSQPLGSRD